MSANIWNPGQSSTLWDASNIPYTPAGSGAVTTNVRDELRQHVSLKDFGAIGNGVADDTAALNLALAYCATSGHSLYIPAGTYLLTSNIAVPRTGNTQYGYGIFGEGKHHASILNFSGAAVTTGLTFDSVGVGTYQYWDTIRDFEILCSGGAKRGISVNYSHHLNIDSIQVNGASEIGMFLHNCNTPRVSNCLFINCGSASYGQVELDYCTDFLWDQNYIAGSASAGWGMRIDRCPTGLILGGSIESTGIPIELAGKAESSYPTRGITIIGIGIEAPKDCYIKMGYGVTAAYLCSYIKLIGIQGYTSGSTTVARGLDINMGFSVHVDCCQFPLYAGVAIATFDIVNIANCSFTAAENRMEFGAAWPWVKIAGVVDMSASPYYDYSTLCSFGIPGQVAKPITANVLDVTPYATQGGMYNFFSIANAVATNLNRTNYIPRVGGFRITFVGSDSNVTVKHLGGGGTGQFFMSGGVDVLLTVGNTMEFVYNSNTGNWNQL